MSDASYTFTLIGVFLAGLAAVRGARWLLDRGGVAGHRIGAGRRRVRTATIDSHLHLRGTGKQLYSTLTFPVRRPL